MSLVTLDVWITPIGDPCHISDATWFVHVVDCEGNPVRWCTKNYLNIEAKCGHAEIQIPPGCYVVFATENATSVVTTPTTSQTVNTPGHIVDFGNQLTHVQIVRANCGDHFCVTLFSPSLHFCGGWFGSAVTTLHTTLVNFGVGREIIDGAVSAVEKLLAAVPADRFSTNLQAFMPKKGTDRR
jgi:hypothetical protein